MSHPEQLAFFRLCADANRDLTASANVLEIGSYDVNGSVRAMFSTAGQYCGVDLVDGPGVDRIGYGHEVDDLDGSWDIALSAECFEHDPHWRATLANMVRLTRPGGLVVVSCASTGRVEHGTRRTTVIDSPGTQFEGLDYYCNVTAAQVSALPVDEWFSAHQLVYNATSFDLYLVGVRAGTSHADQAQASLPALSSLHGLTRIMTPQQRLVRLPLRILSRVLRRQSAYQRVAIPYWLTVIGTFRSIDRVTAAVRRLTSASHPR
ncbi:bifunctional 2-polyprenyl-6-hydroxyphenol methylase/3-demethylubiquinol 3-O-methyltransferase UbiG [Phycicoccus sp. Root101]|uniref:class I SAM-dependent methyltransferase n=1 Tax=Phycicoccus sp. Root101 TaxID=1736421 RepID=UPI0007039CB8|nr:methyltransferase domain-containing protein [Phycicoccus sp. Root101]KQU69429.1 hypothetical protein ASC58_05995 [Phycicoccus sp. Root101]